MSSRSAERIGGPRGRARAPPRIGKWRRKGQQRMALGQTERARRETREPMAKYCLSCVCVSRGPLGQLDEELVQGRQGPPRVADAVDSLQVSSRLRFAKGIRPRPQIEKAT